MKATFESIIENFNGRNEFLTKLWVWIIILSLFGFIIFKQVEMAQCQTKNNKTNIELPILNLPVPLNYSVAVLIIFLSGLIFKWLESFLRLTIFRRNIIESLINKNPKLFVGKCKINTRRFFDGLVFPGSTAVYGFVSKIWDNSKKTSKFFKILNQIFYVFLKIISFIAHFIIPFLVLIIGITKLEMIKGELLLNAINFTAYVLSFLTFILLIKAGIVEIMYINKIKDKRFN